MPIVRSAEYKAKMSIAATKREALRHLKRCGVAPPDQFDLVAPSTNSTNHQAPIASTPSMPLDPASDPCLTPPLVSIDAKRLRELAAAGNDLWACASALWVTPEAIERAIAPTTWATYAEDAQRAGQAHIKVALHRRATTGDARAVELLLESQPTSGEACPQCRRIESMTNEELRAERERLQRVLNAPRYGGFSHTPLPPTVHVIATERPVIARPKPAGALPA
jgi:hypothetical protein